MNKINLKKSTGFKNTHITDKFFTNSKYLQMWIKLGMSFDKNYETVISANSFFIEICSANTARYFLNKCVKFGWIIKTKHLNLTKIILLDKSLIIVNPK